MFKRFPRDLEEIKFTSNFDFLSHLWRYFCVSGAHVAKLRFRSGPQNNLQLTQNSSLSVNFIFSSSLIIILFCGLSGCGPSNSEWPCLCDMPSVPDMPSNKTLAHEAQAQAQTEELTARPETFSR